MAGTSISCGCYRKEITSARNTATKTKHGMCGAPVYAVWFSMLARCRNKRNAAFADYGGRGIAVCERWHDFRNFYADMGDPPAGMTIERRDNDLGYSKGNCYWATWIEQAANRRPPKPRKRRDVHHSGTS